MFLYIYIYIYKIIIYFFNQISRGYFTNCVFFSVLPEILF